MNSGLNSIETKSVFSGPIVFGIVNNCSGLNTSEAMTLSHIWTLEEKE